MAAKDSEKPKEPRVTTVRLPEEWYEDLRTRAFHERKHIADLIREALKEKFGYPDPEECRTFA